MLEFKVCNNCGKTKPFEDYDKSKTCTGGRMGTCKDCRAIKGRERYEENRDKVIAKSRDWNEKNREKVNQNQKRYQWAKYLQGRKNRRLDNPDQPSS